MSKRKTDYVTEHDNGNISIRYDKDLIERAKTDPVYVLSEVLYWMDCYIEEDEGLNWLIHNVRKDVWYRLDLYPVNDLDRLLSGKTLRLVSFKRKDIA